MWGGSALQLQQSDLISTFGARTLIDKKKKTGNRFEWILNPAPFVAKQQLSKNAPFAKSFFKHCNRALPNQSDGKPSQTHKQSHVKPENRA